MVRSYYKADRVKTERLNYEAWLYGVYTTKALEATLGNVFKKKGAKPIEYPEKPIEFYKSEEDKNKAERDKEQEKERLRLVAKLNQVMNARKKAEVKKRG